MTKFLQLACGKRIAYQRWGERNASKVFCCHGWLDNSNSFSYLGPYLASHGYDVVAIDHLGHGRSDYLENGIPYIYASYVSNISSFLEEIEWNEQTSIIAHSMSAGISMLFAGMYPEKINKLCLIDGFGPITAAAAKTPALLKKAIDQENAFYKGAKDKKVYENVGKAIDARVRNVSSYPGKQSLSREAAASLVCRGTMLASNNNEYRSTAAASNSNNKSNDDDEDIDENNPNSVIFRHDPRLFLPSYTYFSNEQILHFIDGITSKTLLIQGENGWPVESSDIIERKTHFESKENLLTHKILPGSHHLHLDPLTRAAVGLEILNFLKQ